jgi:signal transduction histidine kinase/CheY-like chemotaxis protein
MEVRARFGMLPNFFRPAPDAEGLSAGLWAFTQAAYLDSPLPSVFKERLFVHLSRFCEVRYCVIRHACFLAGLGRPAGDPDAPAQTAEEITALLRRPVPEPVTLEAALSRLEAGPGPAPMPGPGTQREADLFDVLTVIFLDPEQASRARAAVTAAAGNAAAELLMGLLACIRAAHYWTEIHPDLPLEPDATAFLDQHPELARLLTDPADALAVSPRAALHAVSANREAQQRAQRDFVANAAHELRTPLAAVVAAIDTLDRGAIHDVVGRERFFGHIRAEAARLSRLCDSLLMLAEAQSGSPLPASAVPLRAMLDDIAARLRAAPGVAVSVEAPGDLTVTTNVGLLDRILTNLAGNAAKYTSSGQIALRAAVAGNGVTVEIRDTGRGLGLPSAEAVERFSRGGARTADGFGLGLSIAHQAAVALNATLRLQDNADGGTLATLSLPHTPPASARILVIEDEQAIRDAVAYTLQAAGYQVTEAATGLDGLDSTRRERPFDLIIVDLLLPDVPGTDVIRQLRSGHDGSPGARILAVTAHTRVGTRDLALSAGADQFLTKPFTMNQLLEQAGALTIERAS